jgi:hypothetical protein
MERGAVTKLGVTSSLLNRQEHSLGKDLVIVSNRALEEKAKKAEVPGPYSLFKACRVLTSVESRNMYVRSFRQKVLPNPD